MKKNITKQDILDYFNNQHYESCEFKEECNATINLPSLCSLFGVT